MGMLPKVGPFANLPKNPEIDEKRLGSVEAIINSMTAKERENHNLIDGKRRKRIALGSGTSVQEVNQVLKQYQDMKKMMKQYGAMAKTKMRGLGKFAGLKTRGDEVTIRSGWSSAVLARICFGFVGSSALCR